MNTGVRPRNRIVLGLLVAFLGGVMLDRTGWLPGAQPDIGASFAPFWETWQLVDEHYVDRPAVKPQHMIQGAIRGMLDSLGDVGHTTYLTKEEFAQAEKNLQGKLYGIGARLSLRKGEPTVAVTFPDSPAQKGGLLPGDILLAVEGHSVKDLSLEKIVLLVRGKPGTTVQLRVRRKGHDAVNLTIRREELDIPIVTWHFLPGTRIVHLAILEFGAQTDSQLRKALQDVKTKGAKGLLVDIRANPGGLKNQAVAVTSEFLKDGTVFLEQDAKGKQTPVPVSAGGQATQIPMCVLIDEGTASAAEIFAGAIQDYHRGKLIGARTFGTGTVLQPFRLSDKSVVLLATGEWLTPKGRKIWHQGITPDIEVPLPEAAALVLPDMETSWTAADLEKSSDRQLLKAFQVLKAQLSP